MLWHLKLLLQRPGHLDLLCRPYDAGAADRRSAVRRSRLLRGDRANRHPARPSEGLRGLRSRLAGAGHALARELVEPPAPLFAPSSRLIRS